MLDSKKKTQLYL